MDKEDNPLTIIKPNIKNIIFRNFLNIILVILLLIVVMLILNYTVGLLFFSEILKGVGIIVNPRQMFIYVIFGFIFVLLFVILGNFLVMQNVRYEFYKDKLVLYQNKLLFFNKKEVPYQNILGVSYKNDNFFDKFFNTGEIILNITGTQQNNIILESVNKVYETTTHLKNLIDTYKGMRQAKLKVKGNIKEILEDI